MKFQSLGLQLPTFRGKVGARLPPSRAWRSAKPAVILGATLANLPSSRRGEKKRAEWELRLRPFFFIFETPPDIISPHLSLSLSLSILLCSYLQERFWFSCCPPFLLVRIVHFPSPIVSASSDFVCLPILLVSLIYGLSKLRSYGL